MKTKIYSKHGCTLAKFQKKCHLQVSNNCPKIIPMTHVPFQNLEVPLDASTFFSFSFENLYCTWTTFLQRDNYQQIILEIRKIITQVQ